MINPLTYRISYLWIFGALAVFLCLLYGSVQKGIIASFLSLERTEMLEDIGRCTNLIHSELEQLVTTAGDYAGWDDTYAFVQTGDAAFTSTNLQPATLTKLRLDLVAIADANGKIVYLYLQHYTSGAALAASPALLSHLTPRGKLLTNPSPQSSVSGMLHLPEGIMMVAARPILKSDSSGPAKGTLLFGRFLDRTEVKRLAGIVNFTMSIDNDLSEIKLDSSHQSSAGGELLEPIVSNSDRITGRAVIRDIYGKTAGLVQVVQPRLIYQKGLRSVNKSFTVTALISLLFCGLLIYYLREREVERKRAEEKLSALNAGLDQQVRTRTAELKAAIQEQESFSYSVSHDLRAPLRHINSFSSMLLEDYGATLPTEARNYLERITYSTKKMGALIDHLLELSRVIRTEIRMDSIDLSALARDIANMLKETEPTKETPAGNS